VWCAPSTDTFESNQTFEQSEKLLNHQGANSSGSSLIPQARLLFFGIRITIREANVSDTDVITEFNSQMALETEQRRLNPERLRKGVVALLGDKAKGVYFLAEIENETNARTIAGQLMLTYEWSDWRNGNFWWIQSVYVAKEFRGKGVFKALFQQVKSLAAARTDVCGLRLYMDAQNQTARQTYDRIGFHQTNYEIFEIEFS